MRDPRPTVLIVDNDDGMVSALSSRLEHQGYSVVTAGTGAQGLAVFRTHEPDLVITDLNMPTGDGITLARHIRNASKAPIIIVTGFKDEYRDELRSIAHVSVLRKPFESSDLLDLIEMELTLGSNRAAD